MKKVFHKIVPKQAFSFYHWFLAKSASVFYGQPSNKMVVIGVTGTKGKTTTCHMIAKVLEAAGYQVGMTTTASFKIGPKEWLNDKKMTMLGRFALQGLLKKMVKAGCTHAVIETSSEGIKQFRNVGINYDLAVFTNLSPEHLEAHGGFENYKQAKGKLFASLSKSKKKKLGPEYLPVDLQGAGKGVMPKISVANADDELADYFLNFKADKKLKYSFKELSCDLTDQIGDSVEDCLVPCNMKLTPTGTSFNYKDSQINIKLLGEVNVYNAIAALAVGVALGIPLEKIKAGLEAVETVPGRMEFIKEAKEKKFTVIVDYAHEPRGMKKFYVTVRDFIEEGSRLIVVTGSCGGGRDKARRPVLGRLASQYADYVIVTNEDPYDENPEKIIDQVLAGALESKGRELDRNVFKILDRREGIKKALELAKSKDVVVCTGKGAEQWIMGPNGTKQAWDDREIVRELLKISS